MARTSNDTVFTMYSLSHLGLNLGGVGRYAEAAQVFDEVRHFGQKYGVLPLLARATSMSAGFHLNVFDFTGAEALALEARERGRSAGFARSVVSAGIDLLLIFARRHELSTAAALLSETEAAVATTPGWHEWLWQLRLCQVRAELAFASGAMDAAVAEARRYSPESDQRETEVRGARADYQGARVAPSRSDLRRRCRRTRRCQRRPPHG